MPSSLSSVLVALALGCIALFSFDVKSRLLERGSPTGLQTSQQAPTFNLPDPSGTRFALEEVTARNKVVLVTFWATWCGPCRIELAALEKLYKSKGSRGFTVLAINEDREPGKLEAYLKEQSLTFPTLVDSDGQVAKSYGVEAFPTSVLLDSKGRVLNVFDGLQPYLDQVVELHLKQEASDG